MFLKLNKQVEVTMGYKKLLQGGMALAVSFSMVCPSAAFARNGEGTTKAAIVAGTAAVILGLVALSEKESNHDRDDRVRFSEDHGYRRDYDRGYRVGNRYHRNYHESRAYADGFRTGPQVRSERYCR